jgi:hypothetical protein
MGCNLSSCRKQTKDGMGRRKRNYSRAQMGEWRERSPERGLVSTSGTSQPSSSCQPRHSQRQRRCEDREQGVSNGRTAPTPQSGA